MSEVLGAIEHTPVWVWPVLALLIWLGVRRMRASSVSLARLMLLPAIFLVLSLGNALSQHLPAAEALAIWLAGLALGASLGWLLTPRRGIVVDRAGRRLHVPGSIVPLLLILAIFAGRYAFGYTFGRWPELQDHVWLVIAATGFAAFCAGVMQGRTLPLLLTYRRGTD